MMREFTCKSLGYDCSWKHIARTEELLADTVAVHLRDIHGIPSMDQGLVGKVKNLFTNPPPVEAVAAESLVLKEYNCDIGPGCTWRYIAQTEELIADGVAVHARQSHGVQDFSREMITKVKNASHEWKG